MQAEELDKTNTMLTSENPCDGSVVGEYPIDGAEQVQAAVAQARAAFIWWTDQGARGRRDWLLEFKRLLAGRAEEVAELIRAETGKPLDDALLEVSLTVGHLEWAAKNAHTVLRRRRVSPGATMINHSASVGYQPYGVVGVIGPWNYPLYTPMGSISYALAAGNTVVFKPSEYTPGVGVWLAEAWESMGAPGAVIHVVIGSGETGRELCRAGVDKLAFTGSPGTARKVMGSCAESLTPVVIEGGGKDALIVAADADLDAAADQAVFGAMGNAGQTCAGVERIYVAAPVYAEFLQKFTNKVRALRPGTDSDSSYGPLTFPPQREKIVRHIAGALSSGARAEVGGLKSAENRLVEPVVLCEVPEDSEIVREETFGPVVVVNKVADLEEGVDRANDSAYGLGGYLFTKNRAAGWAAAERLRAGGVAINAYLAFAAIPALPFGGSGESGFGRIHGPDGLREFSRPKAVTVQRFRSLLNLMTMSRTARDMKIVRWMLSSVQAAH